jgi:hypothetical protein
MITFLIVFFGIIGYLCGAMITGIYWGFLGWPRRIKRLWDLEPEWPTVIALCIWPITLILILINGFRGILK